MRKIVVGIITVAAYAGIASAQDSAHNPAVKNPDPVVTTIPAKGANSFTEKQARSRMAKAGYPGVTNMVKNSQGQWVGSTMKGAAQVTVMLDYKGNVSTH